MLKSFFITIVMLSFGFSAIQAQTFNGGGGAIPDDGTSPTCFSISVAGVGTINNTFGLATVCLDITHTWDSDLEITLVAPDGTSIPLAIQEGGSGDNFTGTCFTGTAITSITNGTAPFTGDFLPENPMGSANNGQNADGQWTLCIQDIFAGFTGTLNNWSITFNNTPAPPPPVQPPCSGNLPAGNDCTAATPVCNFDGYCGNTSAAYSVDTWTQLTAAFCGSIDNNSFITFVASATTASFNVWVSNSQDGLGIQMMFYDGGCGSGAVNEYGCYGQMQPSAFPTVVTATGLTIGNTYYLMFDGYAGDVCDYTIAPLSGVNILDITTNFANATICLGQSINLTASGGNGTYTWSGPNLSGTTGNTVIASPTTTSVYTVTSSSTSGDCPLTRDLTVNVTVTPDPPTVSTPLNLCQGAAASPLTATGTDLLWYTNATGGTGSSTAPTPNTSVIGSTTYYVSQTLPCGESPRVPIVVNVSTGTPAPLVSSPVVYCQNATAIPLSATGIGLLWFTTAVGGTGNANAPTPVTTTSGTTTYYVSQSGSCGESPRASIVVNITAAPPAPTVTTPLNLCLNSVASPLTATGNGLLWYNNANGGTGNSNAPTPSTAISGNTNYYVSQTVNGCESPRATLTVTVLNATTPPVISSPVVYCEGATANPLTATGPGLLWYTTGTGGTGSATAPVPVTSTAGNTVYYVSQSTNCGESPRAAITVIVNPIPAAPAVNPGPSYCIGVASTPLTAVGSSLQWYTVPVGGTPTASITPSTSTLGATIYYVSQTLLACESPRASITVTITGLPPAPTATDDTLVYCQLTNATPLSATGTALQWYLTPTGGAALPGTPTPSTLNAGITTYYVTQTLSCGESQSTPIVVVVDTTPVAPTIVTPVVYCQGVAPVSLTANGSNILWYNTSTGGIGTALAPTPTTISTGNTSYYVSSTIGSCEGPRAELTVTVNPTPPIPQVNTPITYCAGNATTPLVATGSNILWYTSPVGGNSTAIAPIPTAVMPGTTSYYASQTLGVCEGPRTPVDVTILATPNLGVNLYDTICFADTYNLNTLFNTTGLTVNWTYNGTAVIDVEAISATGTYQIAGTNSNGCSDTALFFFTKLPPVIAFAGNDTIAAIGLPQQLHATGGVDYSWSPALPLDYSNVQSPVATLYDDQQFIVTVYNEIGCAGYDTVFVQVYREPSDNYYLPNAFTPNGDGLNDIFRPVPVGEVYTDWFKVYNRNGQLLFNTKKWMQGWDGTYMGRKQQAGTYVWVLQYHKADNVSKIIKGTVILIK